jgi:tetratricopeptide (TPR) repeat protein
MTHGSIFRSIAFLTIASALMVSCSRDPNVRKQKYLESGERYFEKEKYREAAIQFGNALQVDANFADAHYHLAETYLKLEQWRQAYEELSRTIELQPQNYAAHLDLANLLIAAHDLKHAQEHTNLLQEKQPNNIQVHAALADLLAAQGNISAAIQEAQKAIDLGPQRWESYLAMARLQMNANQPDLAETNFKKAVELNPQATPARLALGNYYQFRGRFSEAEQQVLRAIVADPKNPDSRSALVQLYMAEGKKSQAEDSLRQVKQDFSDNSAGYRMLGDFYFATGDIEKALAEYALLYQTHPKDIRVKKNYVQLLILRSRLDEGRGLNDEILKTSPNDEDALICRSQIQNREGHSDNAAETLQTVINRDPDNAVAHYQLGLTLNALGNVQRAEIEWQNAVRLSPDLYEAQRALADAALREGDLIALDQYATKIIALQPFSPDGYALRAVSCIHRQQFVRAEQDVHKAQEVAPQNPVGYIQMGNLKLAQQQFADAERSFQQALDRDSTSPDALAGLMNTYIAQQQPDKAVTAANTQIVKAPNSSAFYDLLGTVLFNSKRDRDGAAAAFQKSIELDKSNADALTKLGQVQAASGSVDAAIATYQNSLKDNPRQPSLYILTGGLYESRKDWDHARQMYQKALEISPENPLASNNLAYVILRTGGNVDVALSLAQTARRGMPDSPNAADTLGWIFYQKGAYKSAIDLFQEALKLGEKNKSPEDATVHYHLGLAYERTDQPKLARQHLQRVLKIDPNYSDAADVKKQLAQLAS